MATLSLLKSSAECGTAVPTPANAQLPTEVGHGGGPLRGYRPEQLIGRGGFCEVWRAVAPGGFPAAIKIITRPADNEERRREEAALDVIKKLNHHFLLRTTASWSDREHLFIVMELADRSLRQRFKQAQDEKDKGIPVAELLRYFREAAAALDYLHQRNVLHRDIKPDNILLIGDHVRLADFGLARIQEPMRASASLSGTPPYMAPEVWRGETSKHSDQYSLACTYAELRLGRRPFPSTDHTGIMFDHLEALPQLASLPAAEQQVLFKALAKNPEDRYPNCLVFVQELETAITSPPAVAPVPEPEETIPSPPVERSGSAMVAVMLSALVLGGLLGRLIWPYIPGKVLPAPAPAAVETTPQAIPEVAPTLPQTLTVDLGGRVTMEFVLIDPRTQPDRGRFHMGSSKRERDGLIEKYKLPANALDHEAEHPVEIAEPFYLAKDLVTQEQYQQAVGWNPSYFQPGGWGESKIRGLNTSKFPVECVNWHQAALLCETLNRQHQEKLPEVLRSRSCRFALPTEAQWEYACRTGTATSLQNPEQFQRTMPVRHSSANALGLYALHGNVWQWCADSFDRSAAAQDHRVLRGGSWNSKPWECRSANRGHAATDTIAFDIGCRLSLRLTSSP